MLTRLKQHGTKTLRVSGGFVFCAGCLKPRPGLDYTCDNTLNFVGLDGLLRLLDNE